MTLENSCRVKGAGYACKAIELIAGNTPNLNARRAMTRAAIHCGNYTQSAKALWAEYLERDCPRSNFQGVQS